MKHAIHAFFAFMMMITQPAFAGSKDGALATVNAWVAAVNRQDVNGVVANFAGDASFFGTSSKTLVGSAAGIREYFAGVFARFAPLSVELGEVVVNELSPDSAVVTGYDKWKVTIDGKAAEGVGRLSIAVARRDGQWRIVSFHRSALPN